MRIDDDRRPRVNCERDGCEQLVTRWRVDQKFCSAACRQAGYRKRLREAIPPTADPGGDVAVSSARDEPMSNAGTVDVPVTVEGVPPGSGVQ